MNFNLSISLIACAISTSVLAMSETPITPLEPVPEPSPSPVQPSGLAYADDFRLLAYNVYMLPELFAGDWSHENRAVMIPQSEVVKGQDAILLQELFDNTPATALMNGLKADYPYQTPVMGRSKSGWDATLGAYADLSPEDGGVAIVSRWPITEQIQYVYKDACGADYLSNKGFVYARVDKNGAIYHLISTHAQAEDGACDDPAATRKSQFTEMQNFIAGHNIPADEVVFMGGDFNVIKHTAEYPDLIETLQVSEPDAYAGFSTSWDPESNGMAAYNYPDLPSEYLDYIFVSRNHAQPSHWHNPLLDVTSTNWGAGNYRFQELTDHYPLARFSYDNAATCTTSFPACHNLSKGEPVQTKAK